MARKKSLNAQAVAHEVIKTALKGGKVNVGKIAAKHGYSEASVRSSNVLRTQTFKDEMEPFVTRLIKMRDKIIAAMDNKNLDAEKFRDLSEALTKNTHDIQLLQGKHTSRIDLSFDPDEEAQVDKLLKGNAK